MNTNIHLNELVLSPQNVRKTPPTDGEQAELAASIRAHGLLENLIVRRTEDGGHEVLAGGRRLMAMQNLARAGELAEDHPVACLVHDGDPGEVSLAENIVRLSMHPLDQFEAFAALADQDATVTDIAVRFGHTEKLVRQRLRLGRVAPAIRAAYRADDINLDTLMAFAVTEDHGQQLAVWNEIKGGHYVHANHVRRLLTDEKIAASSRFVKFVGLEAYEAAGGTFTRDLFSDGDGATYLEDRARVMELALNKLVDAAQALQLAEGWKWTRADLEMCYADIQNFGVVYPQRLEPTAAQEAEMERLQNGIELYEAMDQEDGLGPEDEEKLAALEEQSEALENSLSAYAPEDVARSGCMIAVNHDGSLQVRRGLIQPEDQQVDPEVAAKAPAAYSAKLLEDLGHFRLEVAQKHLAQDFDCAFDMMLFTLARATLDVGYHSGNPLDIAVQATLPHAWSERSGTEPVALPPEVDLDWLKLSPVDGFAALSAMPKADKQRLFAHCTALTMQGGLSTARTGELHEMIGRRLDVDTAAHWRPTAETFFKRVTRARALEIASDVLGEQWATNHKGEKKGVLVDTLAANFTGNRTPGVTPEQAAVALRWLPEGMAYPANHDDPVSESCDLPEAFCVPAAE